MTMIEAYAIIQEFARVLKSPEPDDLTQDVVIKLMSKPDILSRPEGEIRNYLFFITKNKHIDNCRTRKNNVELPHSLSVEVRENKINNLVRIANLTEIEIMWLEAYMDMGDFSKISRELKVNRTDVSKIINNIFIKCRQYKHLL